MKAEIAVPEQAWAMLSVLGVDPINYLKGLPQHQLRTIGKLIVWIADYNVTQEVVKKTEPKP